MDAVAFHIWERLLRGVLELEELARREDGQTLAEYSLLLTLVAVGVITPTVIIMRGALVDTFDSATDCISRVTC
jgi:Flp pilus assembly pilin Flp